MLAQPKDLSPRGVFSRRFGSRFRAVGYGSDLGIREGSDGIDHPECECIDYQ
jgi:hypothetical protein